MKLFSIQLFFVLCFLGGTFNLHASAVPEIVTNQEYARGSVAAFCEGQILNAESLSIREKGICWSTDRYPEIDDNTSVYSGTNTKYLCRLEGLSPTTRYFVRAYVLTTDGGVSYGNEIEIVTIPRGNVTYTLNWNAEQNPGNKAHYDRIAAAMAKAVAYYNDWTSIKKHLTANYNSGVPTAEASYSGWMSFGSNSSYQKTGTALHEMSHTIGVGQHSLWGKSPLMINGVWQGERATKVLRFMTQDPSATIKGDGTHFWPYGINGAHEDDDKDMTYIINSLIAQAMGEDGLPPSGSSASGGFATPSKVFEPINGGKYYLKNEAYQRGRNDSFLRVKQDGSLINEKMTAAQALANDSAAWLISFDPLTQRYSIQNAGTKKFFRYKAKGANGIVVDEGDASNAHLFQLMKGRIAEVVGSGDTYYSFRGYWITYPTGESTPPCLAATSAAIAAGTYDISNYNTALRWILMTAEDAIQAEKALSIHGSLNVDPSATYSIRPEADSKMAIRSTPSSEKTEIINYIKSGSYYVSIQWKLNPVEGKDGYFTVTNVLTEKNLSVSKWNTSESSTDAERGRANTIVIAPDVTNVSQQLRFKFIENVENEGNIVQVFSIENDHPILLDGITDSRAFCLDHLGSTASKTVVGNSIRTTTAATSGQRWLLVYETTTSSGIDDLPVRQETSMEILDTDGGVKLGELPEEGIVSIYDITGRLYTQAKHHQGVYTCQLPQGIYIVCVKMGAHFMQQKVRVY